MSALRNIDTLYADYLASLGTDRTGFEEEIRKSIGGQVAIAGAQTMQAADPASEFSPLIPEALDEAVGQVDFRAKHLEFFDWLPKKDTKNTVTTWMKTVENGDPWIERAMSEGLISVNDNGRNDRGSTRIKSYVETRELTDIQNAVPLGGNSAGVPTAALAFQTDKGMLSLLRALERDAMFGAGYAAAVNKLDGIQPQLIRAGQYTNMNGSQVTMEQLEDQVRTLQSAPYYADPDTIFVDPKTWTSLSKQQVAMGRRAPDGSPVTYGFNQDNGLVVYAGNKKIPVKSLTFQNNQADAPPAFSGVKQNLAIGAEAPAIPTIGTGLGGVEGDVIPGAFVDAASKFAAGDVGAYGYYVLAYSDTGAYKGIAAALSITAEAGKSNKFKIKDPTSGGTTMYYHIFRTAAGADQTNIKNFSYMTTVLKTDGDLTLVVDQNLVRNNTGSVMFLKQDVEEIALYQLIKMFRTPLAKTRMTQPFALFTACGLQVKVPEHQWLYTNVGH